jgi:hypothetical protein
MISQNLPQMADAQSLLCPPCPPLPPPAPPRKPWLFNPARSLAQQNLVWFIRGVTWRRVCADGLPVHAQSPRLTRPRSALTQTDENNSRWSIKQKNRLCPGG